MTDVNIIFCTEDPAELYRRYDGQNAPQPSFIELDLADGALLADYNPEIGNAVPMPVFHGMQRRYPIPVLTAQAANRVLEQVAPLAQRILNDSAAEWVDGNTVAELGDDAQTAEREISDLLCLGEAYDAFGSQGFDDKDLVAEWDIDGALNGDEAAEYGITADTSDGRLEEIAADIIAQLAASGPSPVAVVPGLDAHLRQLRDDARNNARDGA